MKKVILMFLLIFASFAAFSQGGAATGQGGKEQGGREPIIDPNGEEKPTKVSKNVKVKVAKLINAFTILTDPITKEQRDSCLTGLDQLIDELPGKKNRGNRTYIKSIRRQAAVYRTSKAKKHQKINLMPDGFA